MVGPIVIELRGEPKAKGRPRFIRATGRAYTDSKTRSYESHLRLAAQDAMGAKKPIEGPVTLSVSVHLPVPRSWTQKKRAAALLGLVAPTSRPDWDNYGKLSSDALNEIVFRDDSQIVEAVVRKRYSDRPRLKIEVREITGEASNVV